MANGTIFTHFGCNLINILIFSMHFTYICSNINNLSEKEPQTPEKTIFLKLSLRPRLRITVCESSYVIVYNCQSVSALFAACSSYCFFDFVEFCNFSSFKFLRHRSYLLTVVTAGTGYATIHFWHFPYYKANRTMATQLHNPYNENTHRRFKNMFNETAPKWWHKLTEICTATMNCMTHFYSKM